MSVKKDKHLFNNLKNIAAVMVETFGSFCEVAIHDFEFLPNSLIHLEGEVTKRVPGAPITDRVLRALRKEGNNVQDMCSYKTVTKEGRSLKSSTSFLWDKDGKVIGAFCINFDVTDYLNAASLINDFSKIDSPSDGNAGETFASSFNETIESMLDRTIKILKKQPATMNRKEKVMLVESLELQGAFLVKGSVDYVAKVLGVTKYTIYNYLKEIRLA
jgi:predicted transcriptional regulator YheO